MHISFPKLQNEFLLNLVLVGGSVPKIVLKVQAWFCRSPRQSKCSLVSIENRLRAGRSAFKRRQRQWRNFSLRHRFQNECGADALSYPLGTGGSYPRG